MCIILGVRRPGSSTPNTGPLFCRSEAPTPRETHCVQVYTVCKCTQVFIASLALCASVPGGGVHPVFGVPVTSLALRLAFYSVPVLSAAGSTGPLEEVH